MKRRKGSLLLEVSVAATLLTVAFVMVAQLVALGGRQQRETRRREVAVREAANRMEHLMQMSYDELNTSALQDQRLEEGTAAELPEGALRIEVRPLPAGDGQPPGKQIVIHIDWQDASGIRVAPVQLAAWVFGEEAAP